MSLAELLEASGLKEQRKTWDKVADKTPFLNASSVASERVYPLMRLTGVEIVLELVCESRSYHSRTSKFWGQKDATSTFEANHNFELNDEVFPGTVCFIIPKANQKYMVTNELVYGTPLNLATGVGSYRERFYSYVEIRLAAPRGRGFSLS